jgi:eukaryotic-like serine/threonine-protein kinase
MEAMAGTVLADRYRVEAKVRPGRLGDFWRGTRLADRAEVAIKMLKPELFQDRKAVARFERETRLLSAFRHPNLLAVYEVGTTATGAPWIVTEPHDGRILSDAVAEMSLSIDAICDIGAQIARVLASAHARGIVHRGLDSESILLMRRRNGTERVAVQDFGLAHLAASSHPTEPALTGQGERLGRYEYWAPEYVEDTVLDPQTDLYVLGVLLFEMATGQPPFVGPPITVLRKHVDEQPWAPSELAEQPVPAWLDALVLALLAKQPQDRPAGAAKVADALTNRRWT